MQNTLPPSLTTWRMLNRKSLQINTKQIFSNKPDDGMKLNFSKKNPTERYPFLGNAGENTPDPKCLPKICGAPHPAANTSGTGSTCTAAGMGHSRLCLWRGNYSSNTTPCALLEGCFFLCQSLGVRWSPCRKGDRRQKHNDGPASTKLNFGHFIPKY